MDDSLMLGRTAYERSLDIRFYTEEEHARAAGWRSRVLVSNKRLGLPIHQLRGKSVALVGNGHVSDAGPLIDAHDVVVRMKSMRNWKRSAIDDGTRIDLWAGLPSHAVSEKDPQNPQIDPCIAAVLDAAVSLWAVSPFHITCSAFRVFASRGLLERMIVAPSGQSLFDEFCTIASGQDISDLYHFPHRNNLVGLSQFELLLTGTRTALLVELCGAAKISLFGVDLFTSEKKQNNWFGHDLAVDLRIMLAQKQRVVAAGNSFYWHEESRVCSEATCWKPA